MRSPFGANVMKRAPATLVEIMVTWKLAGTLSGIGGCGPGVCDAPGAGELNGCGPGRPADEHAAASIAVPTTIPNAQRASCLLSIVNERRFMSVSQPAHSHLIVSSCGMERFRTMLSLV